MLRGIRKVSENWLGCTVMAVTMTALAWSFAIWGINDIFHGFGQGTLATVGKTEISTDQFRQTYNDRLQQIGRQLGHPLPPDQASALGLDRQVLGEMIAQAELDQFAQKMGLGLSNTEISRNISSNPQLQDQHGQFDRDQFQMLLQDMGYNEQRFVAERRQDIVRGQLVDSISGGITPPQAWLDAINQFQNEQRGIAYVSLGPAQAGDIPAPTGEELSKYFDERKILFRAPDFRKIDTITVTPAAMAQLIQIADDDIKKAYNEQHASFVTPEKRQVEQIVFPKMADAQAAADSIKSGKSFADLAKDRGLKPQDIDLGTVAKASMVDPKVADAAFALKEGEVSGPVQTDFGAVLVTVLKIEPSTTKSLAEATPRCTVRSPSIAPRDGSRTCTTRSKTISTTTTRSKRRRRRRSCYRRFRMDPFRADPIPTASSPLTYRIPISSAAAFASDRSASTTIRSTSIGGYVWYDVAAIAGARPHARRGQGSGDAALARRRGRSRLKTKAADLLDKLKTAPFARSPPTA